MREPGKGPLAMHDRAGDEVDRPERGMAHVLHPQVLGAIIGGAGASAFVHVNRGVLPGSWATVAAAVWLAALGVWAWSVLVRPRRLRDAGPPHRLAGVVYTGAIVGMLAMFVGGHAVLDALGHTELQPAVVVLAVGLHFVPFASVFHAPVFAGLGWTLVALGLLGLVLGLIGGAVPVAAAAVVTGVVMFAFMTVDAVRIRQDAA